MEAHAGHETPTRELGTPPPRTKVAQPRSELMILTRSAYRPHFSGTITHHRGPSCSQGHWQGCGYFGFHGSGRRECFWLVEGADQRRCSTAYDTQDTLLHPPPPSSWHRRYRRLRTLCSLLSSKGCVLGLLVQRYKMSVQLSLPLGAVQKYWKYWKFQKYWKCVMLTHALFRLFFYSVA